MDLCRSAHLSLRPSLIYDPPGWLTPRSRSPGNSHVSIRSGPPCLHRSPPGRRPIPWHAEHITLTPKGKSIKALRLLALLNNKSPNDLAEAVFIAGWLHNAVDIEWSAGKSDEPKPRETAPTHFTAPPMPVTKAGRRHPRHQLPSSGQQPCPPCPHPFIMGGYIHVEPLACRGSSCLGISAV